MFVMIGLLVMAPSFIYSPGVLPVCDYWSPRDDFLVYIIQQVSLVCDDCSPPYGFLVYFIHQVSLVFVMIGLPMMASLFILFTRCPSCL